MHGLSHINYPFTNGKFARRHSVADTAYYSAKKRKKSRKQKKQKKSEIDDGLENIAAQKKVYLIDARKLVRECVCRNLQSYLTDVTIQGTAQIDGFTDVQSSPDGILISIGNASTASQSVKDDLMKLKRRLDPVPVILLTDDDDHELALAALRSGIKGYFPASLSAEMLARAVQLVLAGGTFVPPKLLQEWVRSGRTSVHRSNHH